MRGWISVLDELTVVYQFIVEGEKIFQEAQACEINFASPRIGWMGLFSY